MAAHLEVINDVASIPGKHNDGPGSWTDLLSSRPESEKPITTGIWHVADVMEPTPAWEAEWDEVKFVLKGEIVLKDENSGKEMSAKTGGFIWIPAGSKISIVSSKDLVTIYTEQRAAFGMGGTGE